ncbi:MAG: trehalose-phosphatase [Myxococcota bacterium]
MRMNIPTPNGPCLIMLDFDGTLVPWNVSPTAKVMVSPRLPGLLTNLQQAGHIVVIVTGRPQPVVCKLLAPARVPVVGLHGAQWPGKPLPARNPFLDTALQQLQQLQHHFPQLRIEDKQVLASGHWGQVPVGQKQTAARAVVKTLQTLARQSLEGPDRLSLLGGHNMMELRPDCASKALSAARLLQQHPHLHPVFIGDDLSDEEAFVQLSKLPVPSTTVRVCAHADVQTAATYRLAKPADVHAFLRQLFQNDK